MQAAAVEEALMALSKASQHRFGAVSQGHPGQRAVGRSPCPSTDTIDASPVRQAMSKAIAITGLALILFLLAHLGGAVLVLLDPAGFERYAALLHRSGWVGAVEAGLLLALLAHLGLSLRRALANARARGAVGYAQLRSRRDAPLAVLASRTAPWTGLLLLLFLVVHLAQLRLHRPGSGLEAAALRAALASPWSLGLYCLAGIGLGLHLLHGSESSHRSLGLLDAANAARIRTAGRLLAALVGGGFALLPLAVVGWQP